MMPRQTLEFAVILLIISVRAECPTRGSGAVFLNTYFCAAMDATETDRTLAVVMESPTGDTLHWYDMGLTMHHTESLDVASPIAISIQQMWLRVCI